MAGSVPRPVPRSVVRSVPRSVPGKYFAAVQDEGEPATGPGGVGSPLGLLLALTKAS